MGWTPPSKGTVVISFILWIIGIILYVAEYFNLLHFLPIGSSLIILIAFILVAVAWFLMYLGVKMKGM